MLPMSAKLTKRHLKATDLVQNVIKNNCLGGGTIIDSNQVSKFIKNGKNNRNRPWNNKLLCFGHGGQ